LLSDFSFSRIVKIDFWKFTVWNGFDDRSGDLWTDSWDSLGWVQNFAVAGFLPSFWSANAWSMQDSSFSFSLLLGFILRSLEYRKILAYHWSFSSSIVGSFASDHWCEWSSGISFSFYAIRYAGDLQETPLSALASVIFLDFQQLTSLSEFL